MRLAAFCRNSASSKSGACKICAEPEIVVSGVFNSCVTFRKKSRRLLSSATTLFLSDKSASICSSSFALISSKLFVSVIPVLGLGAAIGFLSSIMGVGGGFIMVPALIYLLKVPTNVVIGTSLFQIIFTSAYTTLIHSATNYTVDVILAFMLMAGGVAGAQYGAKVGQKLRGEQLRALLALLVLAVAIRLAIDLFVTPPNLYSLSTAGLN